MGGFERVTVEVGVEGDVVRKYWSVVWVEVYGGLVWVFVDSLPGCGGDSFDPSFAFAAAAVRSAKTALSPAICEGDVVGKVVVVGPEYVSQEF